MFASTNSIGACDITPPPLVRIEELLDARAAKPEELLQTSPFDVPQSIAVSPVEAVLTNALSCKCLLDDVRERAQKTWIWS